MSGIQDAIEAIQDAVLTISGIRAAPDYPPDQINHYPFVVTYLQSGVWKWDASNLAKRGLHDIAVELHIQRNNLPQDVKAAMGYADSIPNAILKDPTLNGMIDTFGAEGEAPITYEFGPLGYGGVDTLGFRFIIHAIKIRSSIT